jgi:glycosyltransferase involved in cell wall biosynthesis
MPDLTVLLVGRAPVGAAAEAVLQAFHTLPCIWLMGETQDVMPLMSAADVLVLSSRSEGCPTVVLEALACGCRVVSTDVGDVRDIIGPAGQVVEVGDGSALGAALVNEMTEIRSIGSNGSESSRHRVLGRHELATSLSRVFDEYRLVLDFSQ